MPILKFLVQLHLLLIVFIHYNRFHLTKFIIIQLQPIKLSYQQIINQSILHTNYYYLYFIIIIQVHQNQINRYYLFLQPTLKLILLISFVMVHQIQKDFHLSLIIIIVAIIY